MNGNKIVVSSKGERNTLEYLKDHLDVRVQFRHISTNKSDVPNVTRAELTLSYDNESSGYRYSAFGIAKAKPNRNKNNKNVSSFSRAVGRKIALCRALDEAARHGVISWEDRDKMYPWVKSDLREDYYQYV